MKIIGKELIATQFEEESINLDFEKETSQQRKYYFELIRT